MSFKKSAHTERKRSLQAPLPKNRRGGKTRKNGYVHKHELPSVEEAREKYPHGTNARYLLGKCRCLPCGVAASEYNTALREAKRGPWQVVKVSPRVDAPRDRDMAGNVRCRFCAAVRTASGITKHENACKQNPARGIVRHWEVTHRESGKVAGSFDSPRTAWAECRRLNKRDRPRPTNELVSAARARAHLIELRDGGMGMKSISKEAGVAASVLDRLTRGMILRTRRSTQDRILAVKLEPGRLRGRDIPGGPTWEKLDALIAVGYRKGWIAMQLGAKHPALQIGKGGRRDFTRADKARAVADLYERLWASDPKLRMHVDPHGERARIAEAQRAAERTAPEPKAVPLSKRDPAIARRWDDLFR